MNSVLPRSFSGHLPTAVAGDGMFLIDQQGRKYMDGSSGALVSSIGHGNRQVIKAIQDQAARLAFVHTSFFSHEPMENLAPDFDG